MPETLFDFLMIWSALQSLWGFSAAIQRHYQLMSSLILDWGNQPDRIYQRFSSILVLPSVFFGATQMLGFASWSSVVSQCIVMSCIAVIGFLQTIPKLGIYEDGIFVLRQFLWRTNGQFIPWTQIQTYRWGEEGRLLINPGWNPIICKISPEMMVDLKAVLNGKCLDAEVMA